MPCIVQLFLFFLFFFLPFFTQSLYFAHVGHQGHLQQRCEEWNTTLCIEKKDLDRVCTSFFINLLNLGRDTILQRWDQCWDDYARPLHAVYGRVESEDDWYIILGTCTCVVNLELDFKQWSESLDRGIESQLRSCSERNRSLSFREHTKECS